MMTSFDHNYDDMMRTSYRHFQTCHDRPCLHGGQCSEGWNRWLWRWSQCWMLGRVLIILVIWDVMMILGLTPKYGFCKLWPGRLESAKRSPAAQEVVEFSILFRFVEIEKSGWLTFRKLILPSSSPLLTLWLVSKVRGAPCCACIVFCYPHSPAFCNQWH